MATNALERMFQHWELNVFIDEKARINGSPIFNNNPSKLGLEVF